ncbi:MAG: hypothetical protein ACYDAV_13000 [Gammaproteobacteria bacterium]
MKGLWLILCGILVVSIASCGGGGNGSSTHLAPTLSTVSPDSAPVGSTNFTITVRGMNFDSSCYVNFNGAQLNTTFVSAQQLTAQVTQSDVSTGGIVSVAVYSQTDASLSNSLQFTIVNSMPEVSGISPLSAPVGSPSQTLRISGSGFVPSSTVEWNGKALPTTYFGVTELQAQVIASDISNVGTYSVTVENPSPGGGNSSALTFQVFVYNQVNETANDIVWDTQHQLIYLSVPSAATINPNTITAIDPTTNTIITSRSTASDPDVLAISDDDQYLYAGIDGSNSVQRFILPNLNPDISYALGSGKYGAYHALDLQVAPGAADTTAVTLGISSGTPVSEGGIVIYDNSTPRPISVTGYENGGHLYDSLQWGSNAGNLYASDNESSGFELYTLIVDSSGVSLSNEFSGVLGGYGTHIHFGSSTGYIYNDGGQVIDPATSKSVGQFAVGPPYGGVMTLDTNLNRAYFVLQPTTGGYAIESFNLTQFTPVSMVSIPQTNGIPERLIRWGSDGLAMLDSSGTVYLISGPFVTE